MNLLNGEAVMAEVYKEYPRKDKYDHVYLDGHACMEQIIYCKGDWDIVRCTLCGRERQTPCTFDDDCN